jgi:phosphate starvation-inducible PhoH-like protein
LPQLRGTASQPGRDGGKPRQADRPSGARVELQFDDNRLLADLLGEFDAHLSLLEERLGVQAVVHGNVILLEGSDPTCALAQAVLEDLYARLKSGQSVGAGDIDGAIRHARAGVKLANAEGGPEMGQLRTRKRVVSARTPMQTAYMQALQSETLTFATGPAGTGKTYIAVAYAAGCLERGEVERLILSRPAVEAGERLGFLPGDMREKVDPYLRPLYDALYDVLLSHAIAILDEAQNCTSMQMKMFLTRLGEGSKMIVTGDPSQVDLPPGQTSGLREAITILGNVKGIAHIPFTAADVVRHELVARIVEAYEKAR